MRQVHQFTQTAGGRAATLSYNEAGNGRKIVLLPALSSISTRSEMDGLISKLQPYFRTIVLDWSGFGDGPRPRLDWSPELLSVHLEYVLREIAPSPYTVVAAGHAASYVYDNLAAHPDSIERVISVALTWRGPFSTVAVRHKPWFTWIRRAMDVPVLGHLLYAINLSGPVIHRMVSRHVYSDPDWLKGDALPETIEMMAAW